MCYKMELSLKLFASSSQEIIMPNIRIGDRDWSYPKNVNCSKLSKQRSWQLCLQKNPSTGHPTIKRHLIYWASVDFIIEGIPKDYCRIESCLELSSDYSLVIFIVNSKIIKINLALSAMPKQNGPISRSYWGLYWIRFFFYFICSLVSLPVPLRILYFTIQIAILVVIVLDGFVELALFLPCKKTFAADFLGKLLYYGLVFTSLPHPSTSKNVRYRYPVHSHFVASRPCHQQFNSSFNSRL